jgi:hypothetical protein
MGGGDRVHVIPLHATPTTATTGASTDRPHLVVRGRLVDATGAPADGELLVTVALEAVVAETAEASVHAVYGVHLRTGADGRFANSIDIADEVRDRLHGWVMCTVHVAARVDGVVCDPACTRVVRWMRPTSAALITGLGALLGELRVTLTEPPK